jgi:hypothetical protein
MKIVPTTRKHFILGATPEVPRDCFIGFNRETPLQITFKLKNVVLHVRL